MLYPRRELLEVREVHDNNWKRKEFVLLLILLLSILFYFIFCKGNCQAYNIKNTAIRQRTKSCFQ